MDLIASASVAIIAAIDIASWECSLTYVGVCKMDKSSAVKAE